MNNYKKQLDEIYKNFFMELEVDENTGILQSNKLLKFAAFPFIGSRYGKTKKLLIIGLDIGSDEKKTGIISYEERRKIIEDKDISYHNPHISGCYISALYILKKELNWNTCWNDIKNVRTCQKALQNKDFLPRENPLSFISFTNYHKFVTIERKNRAGGENRKYINKSAEEKLLIKEVKILCPDVILFQGAKFYSRIFNHLISTLKTSNNIILIGPHPSYRGEGKREPEYFVNQFKEV